LDTCVPSASAERNNFSAATRGDPSIPAEPGSGVRPRGELGRAPPAKKPKEKPDGTRVPITADEALLRAFTRPQKAVADYLMKRVGGGFPGYACLDFGRVRREVGLSRSQFYEVVSHLGPVLVVRRRGDELYVFSEFAAWCAVKNEAKRLHVWMRTLLRLRKSPRPPVIAEIEDWWKRANVRGPRHGLAATLGDSAFTRVQVPCGKLVDNSVEKAVDGPMAPPPAVRFSGLPVRTFSEQYPPNCLESPPRTDPLPLSLSGDPHFEKSRSLGSLLVQEPREQAHPPAGSVPGAEPASALERQEVQSEFHSPGSRPQRAGPPPLPGDGHVPAPRATETRAQGAPGIQASPAPRGALYVSPGRTDRITYPAFEAAFVAHMRRTKPHWRLIRSGEAVACLRTVWERWCGGKPHRWLDPWLDAQVDAFVQVVRDDGYQAKGFLRHMRAEAVFVPIPGPSGPKKPRPPDGAPRETREDVKAALRASPISHRTG